MHPDWNISLFHYRNQGADYGRILVGMQVPPRRREGASASSSTPRLSVRRRDRQPGLPPVPAVAEALRAASCPVTAGRRPAAAGFAEPGTGCGRLRLHDGAGAACRPPAAQRRRRSAGTDGSGSCGGGGIAGAAGAARAGRRQDAGSRRRQRRQLQQDAARALRRAERRGAQTHRLQHEVAVETCAPTAKAAAACRRRRSAPGLPGLGLRLLARGAITPTSVKARRRFRRRLRRPPAARRRRAEQPGEVAAQRRPRCRPRRRRRRLGRTRRQSASAQNTRGRATSDQITNADSRANMRRLSWNALPLRGSRPVELHGCDVDARTAARAAAAASR